MSRKTVPFKMPGKRAGGSQPEAKLLQSELATGTALPASETRVVTAEASHEWVASRDAIAASLPTSTAVLPHTPSAATSGPIPDLGSLWSLWEATALLVLAPCLLGSFWLFNFYRAKFAASSGRMPS